MTTMKIAMFGIYFGFGALLSGCGDPGELDAADPADGQGGEVSAASCTDSGVANYSAALVGTVSKTSPTRTYGSATCQGLFVVEATNTLGQSFNLSASWGEATPATEQSCPFALIDATAYGYKNGQWVTIGHKSAGGKWTSFFGTSSCSVDAGFNVSNSPYSKVRIASKAAALVLIATQPRRVTGTIEVVSGPPR